ncbi:MAG: hypothetical protein AB7D39_12305 [Pseudodesulfovibrio sp.]|uniref:hypothetical protein n=1 Tax=Pseudodesulfovibrio sp. TaxID=2035812 RepID=UPI003D10BE69
MQHILKNAIFVLGMVLVVAAISVSSSRAMMGGGMQGNGQGGSYGGMMSGSHGSGMTGNQAWNSSMGASGRSGAVSSSAQAESVVKGHIGRNPNLTTGAVVDRGNAFMVDVVTRDGSLVDQLTVQKSDGAIRSVNGQ